MSRFVKSAVIALGLLAVPVTASAAVMNDDFNRADSTNMGPNWTEQAGNFWIDNNQVRGNSGSLMTYNGGGGSKASVDIYADGSFSTQYGAIVLGYADTNNNAFIKVQNNGGTGNFDKAAFYYGNNGSGHFFSLSQTFSAARITGELSGSTAFLYIDSNFDNVIDQTYSYSYSNVNNLGAGVGLGVYGPTALDNFQIGDGNTDVPAPAALGLMGLGLMATAGLRRRRAVI